MRLLVDYIVADIDAGRLHVGSVAPASWPGRRKGGCTSIETPVRAWCKRKNPSCSRDFPLSSTTTDQPRGIVSAHLSLRSLFFWESEREPTLVESVGSFKTFLSRRVSSQGAVPQYTFLHRAVASHERILDKMLMRGWGREPKVRSGKGDRRVHRKDGE